MMKIGFDGKRIFRNTTGLGSYSSHLVSNLSNYFSELDLSLYASNTSSPQQVNGITFEINGPKTTMASFWRSYSIYKDLITDNLDIYHGLSNELPFTISKTKVKSVVTIHDLIYLIRPHDFRWINRKIYHQKTVSACKQADAIIAVSEQTKADLISILGVSEEKINVIYQSCHPIYYQESTTNSLAQTKEKYKLPDEFILSVGTVEPRKNLSLSLHALKLIPVAERPHFVVVGRGKKYLEKMKSLVTTLGLEQNVTWLHNVKSAGDLKDIYTQAKLTLYPSLYEGFGIPIVESLLCKTPVITSETSATPEAAGPDQLLINPQDSKSLSRSIRELLGDEELAKAKALKGYKYAMEKFSPQETSSQLMELYKRIT